MFGAQPDTTLVSMVTKKKETSTCIVRYAETGTPYHIMDYNATKSGVDTVDLMRFRYFTSRTTQRWPSVIFHRILDATGINSFKIFRVKTVTRIVTFNLALSLKE
ncbi:hypothetical protein HHI36_008634 [Cryptolaemus montrouzieri]|uniref:PiggyBac transposable element-derived protein domain-containing protein n=1 Tax=Cryptolaemus montrouzieri TaxID=559131 RepID=A0ABD2MTS3_9CUCU